MAGVDIVHVPYKGSSGARTDVLGGQVQMMFDAVPTMSEHARTGRVTALGTTGKVRSTVLPNVPTIAEAGVAGYEAVIWLGLMAPKGTPRADRQPAERRNREDPEPAGGAPGVGGPGRGADGDDARRIRAVSERRHRQVGAHRQDLRREARPVSDARKNRAGVSATRRWSFACFAPARRRVSSSRCGKNSRRVPACGSARTFGAVGALREKLDAGEPCDVVILTAAMIAELAAAGRLLGGTSAPLGRVRTGVAVRAGDALPSIADRAQLAASAACRPRDLRSRHRALDGRHPRRQGAPTPRHLRRGRAAPVVASERRDGDARAGRGDGAGRHRLHADHRDHVHAGRRAGRARCPAEFELATVYTAAVVRADARTRARAAIASSSSPAPARGRCARTQGSNSRARPDRRHSRRNQCAAPVA